LLPAATENVPGSDVVGTSLSCLSSVGMAAVAKLRHVASTECVIVLD
jgi:hypothetical protein